MSNRYQTLRERQQKEFNALPLGFAFSNEQFDEMMKKWGLDPAKDTGKIYSIGFGGYVQKKDHQLLHETTSRHEEEMKAAIAGDTTGDGFIYEMFLYELRNHEYGYTGDDEDTLEALCFTRKEIMADKRLAHGLKKAKKQIWAEGD